MVEQQSLVSAGEPEPVAVVAPVQLAATGIALFERLALDPNVSIEKLDGLMSLWERMERRRAETAFNAAMSEAQKAMRPVATDADNPSTRSKYASYAALDRALRPIYADHGFALSFNTLDAGEALIVRLVCIVSHADGYAREYRIDMPSDGKGAKGGDVMTKTHATGSAVSYGMRYLLKMIFNVAVGREEKGHPFADDDGNAAGRRVEAPAVPDAPDGFDPWFESIAVGVTGGWNWKALSAAWEGSQEKFKAYAAKYCLPAVEGWKRRAQAKSAAERAGVVAGAEADFSPSEGQS